jgi:uncharacterized membrane protein HdeD (DUF308 family)
MKILKKIKIDMWINAIMTLIIGILFIARPQGAMEVTAIVAGAVIFANGLIDLIYYMNIWSELYVRGVLFEGILKCILGIFIIFPLWKFRLLHLSDKWIDHGAFAIGILFLLCFIIRHVTHSPIVQIDFTKGIFHFFSYMNI